MNLPPSREVRIETVTRRLIQENGSDALADGRVVIVAEYRLWATLIVDYALEAVGGET